MERSEKGFSMVELLMVVALIGLIAYFSLPTVTSVFRISLSSVTREIASTVKETYNSSMVTGLVHRLAYDLEEQQFWVEVGPPSVLLDSEASRKLDERNSRLIEEKKPKSKFVPAQTITPKKVPLPRGVVFENVETEKQEDPITTGVAYTHFFPQGLSEKTVIHLKDSTGNQVSLVLLPLIGKTEFHNQYVSSKEAFSVK